MNLQALATQLREAFPTTAIDAPLILLGEGFGSVVVETSTGIVFRIAKHAEAQRGHDRERRVLPVVQRSVRGLSVPRVQHFLHASDTFPFGVIGYEKLPGRPLSPDDVNQENRAHIAGQAVEFLSALHGIDVGELSAAGWPSFPPSHARLVELRHNVSPYLERHLSRGEHRDIQRWQDDFLGYQKRSPYTPTLVHGDFWYENMLFDGEQQRLVGVIDFENVSIGDAAIDLATQRYVSDRFAETVIDIYYRHHVPRDLTGRMRDLMGLRELSGLEHGIMAGNVDGDALTKVKKAILFNLR